MAPLRGGLSPHFSASNQQLLKAHFVDALANQTHELPARDLQTPGVSLQPHGMKICGFVYLSNHCHLLLRPRDSKQLADFMRYSNSKIAREVGRLHAWKEKIWGRRYTDPQNLHRTFWTTPS